MLLPRIDLCIFASPTYSGALLMPVPFSPDPFLVRFWQKLATRCQTYQLGRCCASFSILPL